jgi:hypothetical protein
MDFAVEVKEGDEIEYIIHRTSCLIVSGRLYPLGDFPKYDLALSNARRLGYTNLNGCYWCCYWNHASSAEVTEDLTQ